MCNWWISPLSFVVVILVVIAYFVNDLGFSESATNGIDQNDVKVTYSSDQMKIKLSNSISGYSASTTVSYSQSYTDCLNYTSTTHSDSSSCSKLNDDNKKGNDYESATIVFCIASVVVFVLWLAIDCGYCKCSIKCAFFLIGIVELVTVVIGIVPITAGGEVQVGSAITILGPDYFNVIIDDSGFSYTPGVSLILMIVAAVLTCISCLGTRQKYLNHIHETAFKNAAEANTQLLGR